MNRLIVVAATMVIAGCCQTPIKTSPSVTLDDAISKVRASLMKARQECQTDDKKCESGLYLSEATLTLEISASTEEKANGTIGIKDIVSLGAEQTNSSAAKNSIELKFVDPRFQEKSAQLVTCVDAKGKKIPGCVPPIQLTPGG